MPYLIMQNSEIILMFIIVSSIIITFILSFYLGARFSVKLLLDQFLGTGFDVRVEDFTSYNKFVEKGNIVFVGDSLTHEYNTYEYFDNHKTYNRGIGGDDTIGLLNRLDESIFDLSPSTVVLLIGTNDLVFSGLSLTGIANNITKIINKITKQLPNTKILLLSLLPVNSSVDRLSVLPRTNKKITTINENLKEKHPNMYIDIAKLFLDENNELDKKYTRDGLHINKLGYEKLTKYLLNYL